MDHISEIAWLLQRRSLSDTWYAATHAAIFAEYISARRDCHVSALAAFHALLKVAPWIRCSLFVGAPWRAVSAELMELGYWA